jgi:flagellin
LDGNSNLAPEGFSALKNERRPNAQGSPFGTYSPEARGCNPGTAGIRPKSLLFRASRSGVVTLAHTKSAGNQKTLAIVKKILKFLSGLPILRLTRSLFWDFEAAFENGPRIGSSKDKLRKKLEGTYWMNAQVTPSAAGSQLPPDSRSALYNRPRQPQPPKESEASENLTLDAFQRRYLHEENAANSSVGHAITFSQTQAGFLNMVHTALDRMNELSRLCQDSTQPDTTRADYTCEFTQLQNFISDIGSKKFNGAHLFSNSAIEVALENGRLPINAINLNASTPEGGLAEVFNPKSTAIKSDSTATVAVETISQAVRNLAEMQSKVSSNIQRLNLSSEQLSLLRENLSAATNRINGLDLAKSLAELVRNTMLRQSGTAMIAQANTVPQAAMRLLE